MSPIDAASVHAFYFYAPLGALGSLDDADNQPNHDQFGRKGKSVFLNVTQMAKFPLLYK